MTVLAVLGSTPLAAQEPEERAWSWRWRGEVRANIRESTEERFPLRFPFRPDMLPPGQTVGFEQTVDPGSHAEVSLISFTLDLEYADRFAARAKIDGIDLYDSNPTSGDREIDADEMWFRIGPRPERLDLPAGTSLFVQVGKAPKFERQPVRLLESYGVTSTAFNRFEDVQFLVGGSLGTHLYWRAQLSNGNPLFFRDVNALAGDNGIEELRRPNPDPELKSGFPVLYDAEVESYVFDGENMETGGGVGYRWRRRAGDGGIDILMYYYERDLAETVELEGTFYGGDLDLLDGAFGIPLPTQGDQRDEAGGRLYAEWGRVSLIAYAVRQTLAGLHRSGYELEAGIEFPLNLGPISFIQPALRGSYLVNHFRGPATFVAPSVWWDWAKVDAGVRIGILQNYDVTIEHSVHDVDAPLELDLDETLVTLRLRFGRP